MNTLTHLSGKGEAHMVDVGSKPVAARMAIASGRVRMQAATAACIRDGALPKGDVLAAARIAGIMAAKNTPALIPLCHVLPLEGVEIDLEIRDTTVAIRATVRCTAKTGVEMEALAAVSAAALTIVDMCKSMDRAMVIECIQLEEKAGGRSGHFIRQEQDA